MAAQFEISLDTVRYLAQHYGSSFHAALRRYAETHAEAVAVLVLAPTPARSDPAVWRRYEAVASPTWITRFGRPSWPNLMSAHRHTFLLGLDGFHADEHTLCDGNGVPTAIRVEITQTPYRSFVLLWLPARRRLLGRRKAIVPTAYR